MKFNLKTPRIKTPNRHSLLVIISALVVVAVLSASIVHFENVQKQKNAQAAKTAALQAQHDKQAQAALANNAQLQNQVIQATQSKVRVCNVLRAASKPKAPIAIPADCQ